MSNDVYEHKNWWEPGQSVCVEKDEKGNCLMSMSFIMIDMGEEQKPNIQDVTPKRFCEELKTNKDDKTI